MLNSNQPLRLVKHIIRSYARLSENQRVRSILKENLPQLLWEKNFQNSLDENSKKLIQTIVKNISSNIKEEKEIKEITLSKNNDKDVAFS